jgi:hypothetical protein
MVQAYLGKKRDPISKITRTKWTGDMVQVVECLLSKYEATVSKKKNFKMRYHFTPVRIALIT